jgi:DNA-binding transcriptional regulator YdaS (Cro superfamily)
MMNYTLSMNLKTYFIKTKTKRKDFCNEVGIHYQHLNNLLRGERYPSRVLAKKIERATNGKVKAISLLYPE